MMAAVHDPLRTSSAAGANADTMACFVGPWSRFLTVPVFHDTSPRNVDTLSILSFDKIEVSTLHSTSTKLD